jgi:CHRD domain/Secretion system C-terminal sorting domain
MKKATYLSVFLFFGITYLQAAFKDNLLLTAQLSGSSLVPSVQTDARGLGSFMLNKKRDSISIQLSFSGITPTEVVLMSGQPGTNGVVLFNLSSAIHGKVLATRIGGNDVKTNLSKLIGNQLYVLVKSAAYPNGELRGQIQLETDLHFVADMNGAQQVPALSTPAIGLGSFTLAQDRTRLTYRVVCPNLSGNITSAALYQGVAGEVGTLIKTLTSSGKTASGNFVPDQNTLILLQKGELYISVATAANPTGEIRAQLNQRNGITYESWADGGQMVPAVSSAGKAIGVFRLSPSFDSLYYDIVWTGLGSTVDYGHFHIGYAGETYAALQIDFTNTIATFRSRGVIKGSALSQASISRLLVENLTLLLHTTVYPNGEVRGQAIRHAYEGQTYRLGANQVVPPATNTTATGAGFVSFNSEMTKAHYAWLASGLSGPVTSAGIYTGAFGQNGQLLHDITSKTTSNAGVAYANEVWGAQATISFNEANANLLSSGLAYLSLSTAQNPTGEVRGQILGGTVYFPPTVGVHETPAGAVRLSLYPNPVSDLLTLQSDDLNTETLQIRIINPLGQVVKQMETTGNIQQKIDLSGQMSGVYQMVLVGRNWSATERFVKF